ncbi:MAG: hypothetical protein SF187_24170 [Deltaproteobacteria bacterium]|nr:hypothetical protein [Deltaproteobacteria bacterium]
MIAAARAVLICGLGAALLACDGAASARKVPLTELAAQMAAVECAVRPQCTGRPLEATDQDCVTQTTARLQSTVVAQVADAVARGTAVYDERGAWNCVAALKAAGCARFGTLLPESCLAAMGGVGAAGAACASEFDCRADHTCRTDVQCPGMCAPRGAAGADCGTDRDCAPGLRCPDIGGKCAVPLQGDKDCDLFGKPCDFGLTCFSPTILETGRCVPVVRAWQSPVGEPCAILASFFCAPGLSCPVLSNVAGEFPTCAPASASGGACVIGLPDPCPAAEYCAGSILEGTGMCTPRVGRGAACVTSRQCLLGDVCEKGVCGPRQNLGGACETESGCWSRACVGGACVTPTLCD